MSSTAMSTTHLQPARRVLPLNDKDTPSYSTVPDLPKSAPSDPKCTASPSPPPSLASKPPSPTVGKQDKSGKSPSPEPITNHVHDGGETNEKEKSSDEIIDMETFQQILDLDEDDAREFSIGMVEAYFEQASQTFKDMDQALRKEDLNTLSSLGHFLKGSSAALGVSKVKDSCEMIQHYGQCRDEEKGEDLSDKEALDKIAKRLRQVEQEYGDAERWLQDWLSSDE